MASLEPRFKENLAPFLRKEVRFDEPSAPRPPISAFEGRLAAPKPCDDLELSVFESSDEAPSSRAPRPLDSGFFTKPNSASEYSRNCECGPSKRPNLDPKSRKAATPSNGLREKRLAILERQRRTRPEDEAESEEEEIRAQPTVADLYDIIRTLKEQLASFYDTVQRKDEQLASSYNIIKRLNEQVASLQKTVDHLLSSESEKDKDSRLSRPEPKENISIGVMTSFEMVVRSQLQNDPRGTLKNIGNDNFLEGIRESARNRDYRVSCIATDSLIMKLQRSRLQPPQPSIHIDVDHYADSKDELSERGKGWTVYNKAMNNFDRILDSSTPVNLQNKKAQNRVSETNTSKRVTFDGTSSETSVHINKLAGKYLGSARVLGADSKNEMSFSTLQYMQEHRLLTTIDRATATNERAEKRSPTNFPSERISEERRILDITAIKRQTKLV